jgi:hypothetical protein
MVGDVNAAGRSPGPVPLRPDADYNADVATFTALKASPTARPPVSVQLRRRSAPSTAKPCKGVG